MNIMGRNLTVFELIADYSLADNGLFTHSKIEVADAQLLTILVESSASVTVYPQVSDDGTSWYECKGEDDSDLTFNANDEKIAAYLRVAARYFRILIHNTSGGAATIAARVMIRT